MKKQLTILLIACFVIGGCEEKNVSPDDGIDISKYKGYVVVQKVIHSTNCAINGYSMWIQNYDSIKKVHPFTYYYNKYNVGDTIK